MNSILNLSINELNNIVNKDTLIICINYNKNEFNNIEKENYLNAEIHKFILIKKYDKFIFNIKFENENVKNTIKIIKKIKKYFKIMYLYNKKIGIEGKNNGCIIANVENGDFKNNLYFSIVSSLQAMMIKDKKERLNFVYKKACIYLDREIVERNLCGFYNDKCIVKKDTDCTMGCCHHYPHKRTGIFRNEKLQLCEFQINKKCNVNCITCKMYMCPEMEKKGYRYNVFNVPLIKCFFNIIQKLILSISFFSTEEDIMKLVNKI